MSSEVLALALIQLVVFFIVGRVMVELVSGWMSPSEELTRRFGAPERWLLAVLGFVMWSTFLMLIHIATTGWNFSQAISVPLLTIGLLVLYARRHSFRFALRGKHVAGIAAIALVLIALYALPAIRGGSSLRTGDAPWHLGWTEQLLGGESLPLGPAPRFAANAYPWGLHATSATLVRSVPGSDPLIAHEALHLILIAAIPLAAACLARLVNRRAGWMAALAASLIGGFGWVEAGHPDFIASPTDARYGADLVVASPNSLYELLPPGLPRELGLVLLACAAILIAAALVARGLGISIGAGIAIGGVGLVSVPMFLSALAWFVMAAFMRRVRDLRVVVIAGTSAVIFLAWAGPVVINYFRYDGFVNVSPRLGVEWEVGTALASWGLLLPLAVAGLVLVATQPPLLGRDLIAYSLAAALLIAVAVFRGASELHLLSNETLLHQGRFWPPAHLLASALAGIALIALYGWIRRIGPGLVIALLALGGVSPVFASIDLTRTIQERKDGFLYGSTDLQEGSFVRTAAGYLDPSDVVRAENDEQLLTFYLFQFSGVRIAANAQTDPAENPWRIRYKDLAERWASFERSDDFDVDYWLTMRGPEPNSFVRGGFRGEQWEMFRSED